jgi:hypothetical protein
MSEGNDHQEGKAIKNEISRVIASTAYNTYEKRLMKEVRECPIPHHIAVIMDGNRRFAKEFGLTTAEGHIKELREAKFIPPFSIKSIFILFL